MLSKKVVAGVADWHEDASGPCISRPLWRSRFNQAVEKSDGHWNSIGIVICLIITISIIPYGNRLLFRSDVSMTI